MRFLLLHLSLSYARCHLAKMLLTVFAVAIGVATFGAIRSAESGLVRGIRNTVDRMAGKAQLQVSAEGGVPEEMQEKVRALPCVRATSPVIEQIVVPERAELGSVLVMGVDLLGDREMRDYSFTDEDVDIDDPLLFIARPDSAVLAKSFAARAGIASGGSFSFRAPTGIRRVVVRGLLSPKGLAEAFGGNLAVIDVYAAQSIFGRGRRFDRIDIRLSDGVSADRGAALIRSALGPAYRVETPDGKGSQLENLVTNFTAGFHVTSMIALGVATFLIFNAFHVAVNRRRRDIGTLRALGATPRQVQTLFLSEALAVGLIGSIFGLALGAAASRSVLTLMETTTEAVFGVSGMGRVELGAGVVCQSVALGTIASLAGAWGPARAASRLSPVDAFAHGVDQARIPGRPVLRLILGTMALGIAGLIAVTAPFGRSGTTFSGLAAGSIGVVLLVTPLSRLFLRSVAPQLSRLFPVAGRLAADAVLCNPRRTAGTVMGMTLSLAFVSGLGGYMCATERTLSRWMDEIVTSDLYVRASANWSRPDFRFPATFRDELLRIPGVASVESFRSARVDFGGDQVQLVSIEIGPTMDRTRYTYLQGDEAGMRRGLTREGKCAVSDNFARRFRVRAGDLVELASPEGMIRLPIAAVIEDMTNDKGTISIDRSTFLKFWKDDRVDIFDVNLSPGADIDRVGGEIRTCVAGRFPALVSTRREFVAEVMKAIEGFFALTRIALLLALLVASLGIASTLVISVVERNREIGILKALGAFPGQIRRSVVLEGLLLALTGYCLSVPAGNLLAMFNEKVVADLYTGWAMPHVVPWRLLVTLLLCLVPVAAFAAWLPARQAARVEAAAAITCE